MKHSMFIISCLISLSMGAHELVFLHNLRKVVPIDAQIYESLLLKATSKVSSCHTTYNYNLPLFTLYPALQRNTPRLSLGSFPTPIQKLATLESVYNIQSLCIKQDSVSGGIGADGAQLFGGNKVRKLEFLLADALRYNAKSVLTFGCIGSNHAVATATYAQQLGLRCYCMLTPQSDSSVVQRNFALMQAAGAEMIISCNAAQRTDNTIETFIQSKKNHGDYPYFIPTGGSTALGAVGFVNAACELCAQINEGLLLSKPDYIYVAAGSFGTVAGLSLGLKAAGIQSQIIAVCVEPEGTPGSVEQKINILFKQTNELLHERDATFPLFGDIADNVTVVHGFGGTGYGVCTQEALKAIADAQEHEGVCLDETYTGKAFAALLDHAQQGMLKDKNVLFWNTFCDYKTDAIVD
jgi:D-cysteine desulfhydrase